MSVIPAATDLMVPWVILNHVLLVCLSFVVVYQAYRGYRRNGSRPMLFLASGVVLLTIVPAVLSIGAAQYVDTSVYGSTIAPLIESIRVAGLASIVYSLYGQR